MGGPAAAPDAARSWARVRMFHSLYAALLVFLAVRVVLVFVDLLGDATLWLRLLFAELADLALALAVAAIFRPRPLAHSPFLEETTADALRAAAGDVISGARAERPSDVELARAIEALSEPPPAEAEEGGASDEPRALPVLVENPCSFDAHGRAVMSVSVGLPHKPEETGPEPPGPSSAEGVAEPLRWQRLAVAALGGVAGPPGAPPRHQLDAAAQAAWERRLEQTQGPEQAGRPGAAADRFRVLWGAPLDSAGEEGRN